MVREEPGGLGGVGPALAAVGQVAAQPLERDRGPGEAAALAPHDGIGVAVDLPEPGNGSAAARGPKAETSR
jgi:hypothetical protein